MALISGPNKVISVIYCRFIRLIIKTPGESSRRGDRTFVADCTSSGNLNFSCATQCLYHNASQINNSPQVTKLKRKHLSVATKLDLLKKLEKGVSVAKVCTEYGVKKQTVSDIKKAKPKLMENASQFCVDPSAAKSGKGQDRKHMYKAKESKLDVAVMKWYVQQRASGINIRGVELLSAACRTFSLLFIILCFIEDFLCIF